MNNQKEIQQKMIASDRSSAGMDAFSITLSKKCERLATAIYLVTNFLSDNEPLKARLRTLSIEFIRDSAVVKSGSSVAEVNALDALRGNIGETLALLELAFISGLVSEMNFTILKREYTSLRGTIDVKKASRESHTDNILGDTFFGTSFHEEDRSKALAQHQSLRGTKQSSVLAPTQMSDRTPKGHEGVLGSAHTPRVELARTREGRPFVVPAPSPRATTDIAKEGRRSRILKLIKDNREVAIKDIVAHFPDLSEKTIQRELVAMSDSGVLKKFGERRWSRYALA